MGSLSGLLEKVKPALDKTAAARNEVNTETYVELVSHANVLNSLDEILEGSEILRDLYVQGKIGLVGASYSVENGKVNYLKKMFGTPVPETQLAEIG
jgi:carbonic anhydrase